MPEIASIIGKLVAIQGEARDFAAQPLSI